MPHNRFYVDEPLVEGTLVSLKDQEFHHLSRVMRGSVGEEVELVNGKGWLAVASIKKIGKQEAELEVLHSRFEEKDLFKMILVQGIPRMNRLEFVLEKGTELGMTELWLLPTERSEKETFSKNQLERMQQLTISAMKQCGRLTLPIISMVPLLKEWRDLMYPAFFGDVEASAPLLYEALQEKNENKGILFFVGPESGFSEKETNMLRQMGVKGVKLHHNILRTETAALVALTLVSAHVNLKKDLPES